MVRERLISLDVFRGLTIMLMTIVNNPGDWSHVYPPLLHANWYGCTPTDLVFPFFIFIMGVAIPFAMPEKQYNKTIFNKILVRSVRMFGLGLFFNFFGKISFFGLDGIPLLLIRLLITIAIGYALMGNFASKTKTALAFGILTIYFILAYGDFPAYEEVRIPGVLQRIAIVYFMVALLYLKTSLKYQIITLSSILLGYWAMMTLIPIPGIGAPNLNIGTNLASYLDHILLQKHVYHATKTWDPEGILSTLPAVGTGILGLLIGQLLQVRETQGRILKQLIGIGIGLIAIGLCWNTVFPINKSLWTSSYVLYTAGLATLILSLLYALIDIKNFKRGLKPFLVWGVNPMIVFFASQIIPQALSIILIANPNNKSENITLYGYYYEFGIVPYFKNPLNASLASAIVYAVFWTLVLWILYQNKWFIKV
ncbi:acyltransferase family protein [Flavobacterium agrisoli]|uniref:DUF5009 domain-containing protein n=1 Tax=Flavobacterium agrisoli TaxID=2793066 RepID=A0A934PLH2_9FLAO|nr:DUF5009 domain-containing protein [Flavobacterium agrisoli]MBK0369128.1 DUF5009 domain-containing protein [Flavobacterium agrisoli]